MVGTVHGGHGGMYRVPRTGYGTRHIPYLTGFTPIVPLFNGTLPYTGTPFGHMLHGYPSVRAMASCRCYLAHADTDAPGP